MQLHLSVQKQTPSGTYFAQTNNYANVEIGVEHATAEAANAYMGGDVFTTAGTSLSNGARKAATPSSSRKGSSGGLGSSTGRAGKGGNAARSKCPEASSKTASTAPRRRQNFCIREQVSCCVGVGRCRKLEDRMGETHRLCESMFQLQPPKGKWNGIRLRERWLAHLGVTEQQLQEKKVLKPELCWTHFPEVFFHGEKDVNGNNDESPSKAKRRRL